jgi:hypothetical protein
MDRSDSGLLVAERLADDSLPAADGVSDPARLIEPVGLLFASPDGGDLRLLGGSPLIDAALLIVIDGGVVDVHGAVPGAYLGAGSDFGGRETY